jgi:predicted ATPase
MPGSAQPDYRHTQLDPDLLSTPFKVQTNWHVITGAPCSGKTTLINLLSSQGFPTVPEAGRIFIENELAKDLTLDEIRHDQALLTRQIYDQMIIHESELQASEVTFLDRALPDAPAFYRIAGMNPNEILSDCFLYRYATVFMLDRLPYQLDGVRSADETTADYFDVWTERDYSALGYKVVRVPVLPPDQRLAFVLDNITER